MTADKTALDALDRLENDALSGRDGYGDARKDAEIIRNFINTRPQPCGDAVDGKDYKKLYWDLLESWSDLKIKHGVLQEKLEAALTQPKADVEGLKKPVNDGVFIRCAQNFNIGYNQAIDDVKARLVADIGGDG